MKWWKRVRTMDGWCAAFLKRENWHGHIAPQQDEVAGKGLVVVDLDEVANSLAECGGGACR